MCIVFAMHSQKPAIDKSVHYTEIYGHVFEALTEAITLGQGKATGSASEESLGPFLVEVDGRIAEMMKLLCSCIAVNLM